MIAPCARLITGHQAPGENRRHGQHTAIMARTSRACHPDTGENPARRLDTGAQSLATLKPVTAPGRRTGSTPAPETPARDHPRQPGRPRFAGTQRRQGSRTDNQETERAGVALRVTLADRWPGFPGAIWQGLVRVRAGGPAGGPQFAQFGDVVVEGAGADAEQLRDGFPPRVAPRPSRLSQHPDEAGRKRRRWSKDAVPSSGTTTLSFWRVALRGERDFHPFDGVCFQGRIRGRQAGTPRRYASY
jgi:hypothetical protein